MANKTGVTVGIMMGSDSDFPIMKDAVEVFKEFNVTCEVKVLSAHRTPDETIQYAKDAEKNGIKVLIAAAGGAAHLPGVVAAMTDLPVIGVPIKSKSFEGMDSLLSIAQMPPGVPVATMAVDGAKNAAIFACKILAVSDPEIKHALVQYKAKMRESVLAKGAKISV